MAKQVNKIRGIIDVQKLDKTIGEFKILEHVNFFVPTGSITAFIGSNGSGKTTTIKTILGLYPMNKQDKIFIDGMSARYVKSHTSIRYVPEKEEFPNITARKFLIQAGNYYGINKHDTLAQIYAYAKKLGFNLKLLDKKVNKLSSGNKKIVNILQGLVGTPKIVIMDEPTENLDPVVKTLF
jgi:ABC-2 type transport system ATP-binding protein